MTAGPGYYYNTLRFISLSPLQIEYHSIIYTQYRFCSLHYTTTQRYSGISLLDPLVVFFFLNFIFNSFLIPLYCPISCLVFSLFFFHPLLLDIFSTNSITVPAVCVFPSHRKEVQCLLASKSISFFFLNPTERSQVETCGKIKEQLLIQYPEGKIGQVRFQSSQSASRKEEK